MYMIINVCLCVCSGEAKECQGTHQERLKRRRKSAGETSTSVICSPFSLFFSSIYSDLCFLTKLSFLMYTKLASR